MTITRKPHPSPSSRAATSKPSRLLRERRRNFQELLGTVNLVAVTLDRKARITYCNDYFLRLTGWNADEILGAHWFERFIPPDESSLQGVFADLIKDHPATWHHENDILTRFGALRSIRWNNTVLRNAKGIVVGTASIGEDVTDRRKLERAPLEANAQERRRLGSELHDGLGQHLFGVALLARTLANSARDAAMPIAEDLAHLARLAGEAVSVCRNMARGLSPLSDLQGGLVEALRQMAALSAVPGRTALEFSAVEHAPLHLSAEFQDHLFRLAQEAVTNALKHARAHSISVRLEIGHSTVRLEIADDGVGMRPIAASAPGLGLKLMDYRANLIGAHLSIDTQERHGTRIRLDVRQPASAESTAGVAEASQRGGPSRRHDPSDEGDTS